MKSTLKIGTIFLSGLLAGAISLPVLGAAGKELRDRAEGRYVQSGDRMVEELVGGRADV